MIKMTFTAPIVNRIGPFFGNKRKADASPLYFIWGTFVNTAGSTGGVIKTEGTKVIFAVCSNSINANAIKVEPNVANPGEITITTTADDDGSWFALIRDRK